MGPRARLPARSCLLMGASGMSARALPPLASRLASFDLASAC